MIKKIDACAVLMGPNGYGEDKFKHNRIKFVDIHILDGCNYKCARCMKFSPLAKDLNLENKELVFKSLRDLAEITKERPIQGFSILGGEPLLSPDLLDYINEVRRLFPFQSITIITNGFLIPKMSKEFFDTLIEKDVYLAISKYEDKKFYKNIETTLYSNSCGDRFFYSGIQPMNCCMFFNPCLLEQPIKSSEETFKDCGSSLVVLKNGRLWQCSFLCTKYLLNDYFGTKFEEFDEDGIIPEGHTLDEIIEFLKQPKKGCKYCNTDIYDCMYFPEFTKYEKSEWIKEN